MQLIDNICDLWKMTSVQLQVISAVISTMLAIMEAGGTWYYGALMVLMNVLTILGRAMKQHNLSETA